LLYSFVIPSFNNGDLIEKCIDSILLNKLKKEIIIIDDGSTDNTPEICKRYQKKHSSIKYIRQKNQGAAAALNKGIKIAKGDYIYLMDSDDYVSNDFLEIVNKYLKKFDADILTFNCKIINVNKKFKHPYNYIRTFKRYKLSKSLSYLSHVIKNEEFTPVVWLYIFKSKLIKKKKNFIEEISPADDNAFIYEVLTKNSNIVYVNEKIVFHRSHDGSIMRKAQKDNLLNSTQILLMKLVKYSKSISRFYKDIKLFHFFNALCFMYVGQVGLFKFIKISTKNNFFYFLYKNISLFSFITLKFFLKGILYKYKNKNKRLI
jgi:glycosyltransferase involved in cell wall biosynthesis